ncbi:hypothetical protein V6N13_148672 [Hibiscus sabdariffa]
MCCTSLRNRLCNLELRSIEARIGKPLKELRHYNLKLGNFQAKFYAGNDQPGRMKCSSIVKVVLKQLRAQRPRNNQRQNVGPDFPAAAEE